jgi:tRNA-Thr(GGU) m(6)t(6)A37 methyltransferase TsaA
MEPDRSLELQPIGHVIQGRVRPDGPHSEPSDLEDRPAMIEIDATWAGALDGIEEFSHIWVLWWLDLSPASNDLDSLQVRPEGRKEMPLRGIFATRSPRRPNPIAMTPVRLLERQGRQLRIQGLDAFEGTPILDLKPYLRRGDLIQEATTPTWLEQLWRIHDEEQG